MASLPDSQPVEVTRAFAEFAAGARYDGFPGEVIHAAKRAILDTLAATVAGSAEPAACIVRDAVCDLGGREQATIIGTNVKTNAGQAALANGTAAHALDYDDVNYSLSGHPSAPVLAAVLALGEYLHASGQDALAAFVAGFEVECKLGRAQGTSHYARGWHATATHGTIGVAAACSTLLHLSPKQTAMALGIAGSMASGSRQNFGTMTKPLHVGRAAESGLMAAMLAQRGFTADEQMLEAPLGFIRLFSPDDDSNPKLAVRELGSAFDLLSPGVAVKKYPCCYGTHRALDATLMLCAENLPALRDVDRIEVRLSASSALPLIHPRPTTGLEGKFSMQYCVAAALLDGAPRLASFDDAAVQRSEAQALLRRVEMITIAGDNRTAEGPTEVTIYLRDGRTLQRTVAEPRGAGADPLAWEELVDKFMDCAAVVLPRAAAEEAVAVVTRLEELPDLAGLMRTLAPTAAVTV